MLVLAYNGDNTPLSLFLAYNQYSFLYTNSLKDMLRAAALRLADSVVNLQNLQL